MEFCSYTCLTFKLVSTSNNICIQAYTNATYSQITTVLRELLSFLEIESLVSTLRWIFSLLLNSCSGAFWSTLLSLTLFLCPFGGSLVFEEINKLVHSNIFSFILPSPFKSGTMIGLSSWFPDLGHVCTPELLFKDSSSALW